MSLSVSEMREALLLIYGFSDTGHFLYCVVFSLCFCVTWGVHIITVEPNLFPSFSYLQPACTYGFYLFQPAGGHTWRFADWYPGTLRLSVFRLPHRGHLGEAGRYAKQATAQKSIKSITPTQYYHFTVLKASLLHSGNWCMNRPPSVEHTV